MTDSKLVMAALRAAIEWEKSIMCSYTDRFGSPIRGGEYKAAGQRMQEYERLLKRMEDA